MSTIAEMVAEALGQGRAAVSARYCWDCGVPLLLNGCRWTAADTGWSICPDSLDGEHQPR